uniref:PX domain-containing protein n=1 Tax=Globisporangium ultimum (strain ATCC 200006 / CBS 805.95 / DAOM BR144) TaxID=431595 RepID=K3WDS3_GLOUD
MKVLLRWLLLCPVKHYLHHGLRSWYNIMGSVDFLGNPIGLYNVQRQRQSSKQIKKINDLGDAITEGGKGLAGGVWDGIKGVVAAPVRGAERDGASGFVFGIGKGFAGLIVKPTAGFLDLLTSLSRGAKTSAESIDGANHDFDMVTRFRLPRRLCSDGVLVSYSEREATGNAILLLTALDATDEYVYHVYYGNEPLRGLVLLTDKRITCLSANSGQKIWEVALDSSLHVETAGKVVKVSQSSSAYRTYSIECDDEVTATNFRIAVDSARVDLSATRYLLLNLEKNQEEAKNGTSGRGVTDFVSSEEERIDLHLLMENVQDTMVTGLKEQDLRIHDRLLSFTVFQIQVYGGPYQWTVYRRFSEFRNLQAELEDAGHSMESLPPLPPRTFLPSTRDAVAKSRQEALSIFLQAAIMHSSISRSALTLEFLTREAQEVRISLPPLSPTATANHEGSHRGEDSS